VLGSRKSGKVGKTAKKGGIFMFILFTFFNVSFIAYSGGQNSFNPLQFGCAGQRQDD